jgi:DNA-nicking Smr family endonuclease
MSFRIERSGSRVEGMAEGVDRRHLRRLRRGDVPVEWELDLHGLERPAARAEVRRTLARAYEEGVRCVLVIHGRGHHSELGAVLREALPGWLSEPPTDRLVMAFTAARAADGGEGACYVLLRRKRTR